MKTIDITTEEQARKYHRYMWRWLSKHPGCGKDDWPGWSVIEDVSCHCFACWVGAERSGCTEPEYKCSCCPIEIWKSDKHVCECGKNNKLYYEWRNLLYKIAGRDLIYESEIKASSRFAAKISELDWE